MKTPIDKLAKNINKILNEYAEDVDKDVSNLTKEFAKKGAQAVKENARAFGWKDYASGWTSQFEKGRMSSQGVIYNKKPGLPHLLEKGHAKRNGGRVPGRAHIAPVEEKLVNEFVKAVENDI